MPFLTFFSHTSLLSIEGTVLPKLLFPSGSYFLIGSASAGIALSTLCAVSVFIDHLPVFEVLLLAVLASVTSHPLCFLGVFSLLTLAPMEDSEH